MKPKNNLCTCWRCGVIFPPDKVERESVGRSRDWLICPECGNLNDEKEALARYAERTPVTTKAMRARGD